MHVIVFQMEEWGVQVSETDDADGMLTMLNEARSAGEPFDIVFVDSNLSEGGVADFTEQMDRLAGSAKVIRLCHMNQLKDLPENNTEIILVKPVRFSALIDSLESVITCNRYTPENTSGVNYSRSGNRYRGSKKILVAEDYVVNQEVIVGILNKYGYKDIDVANDGFEAIQALKRRKYDLVLMDVSMPVMDGLDVTQQIRSSVDLRQDPDIPIIALTAHALKGDQERFIAAGMSGYVSKPIEQEALLEAVDGLLFTDAASAGASAASTDDEKNVLKTDELSSLNKIALTHRLMEDEDLVKMVLTEFLKDLPCQIRQLNDEVSAKNLSGLARQAHKMKGAAGNVGAEVLQRLMEELEEAGRQSNFEKIDELLIQVDIQFTAIKHQVENII
jgi:CheY-like chemotaxis protein/HPt (histidine-containing phosphotransfer) domain-containing protein